LQSRESENGEFKTSSANGTTAGETGSNTKARRQGRRFTNDPEGNKMRSSPAPRVGRTHAKSRHAQSGEDSRKKRRQLRTDSLRGTAHSDHRGEQRTTKRGCDQSVHASYNPNEEDWATTDPRQMLRRHHEE